MMQPTVLLPAYEKLNAGRGFVILPQRTLLVFSGEARNVFLHKFCTTDVNSMSAGDVKESFILDQRGKTIGFGHVCRLADRTSFFMADSTFAQRLRNHFDSYIIREAVCVEDHSDRFASIFVADCAPIPGSEADAPVPDGGTAVFDIDSVETMIAHADFAGKGMLLNVSLAQQDAVTRALANRGLEQCPLDVLHMRRMESGTPWYGTDVDDSNLPQEVRRDATAISFTKGCYLGQETVAKIDAIGHVNRFLVSVQIADGNWDRSDVDVHADGKVIGGLRSSAWSPKLVAWLGLAYVRRAYANPGTNLTIAGQAASVVELPVFAG